MGLCGAMIMAADAALKVGTGLVSAVTWKDCYPDLASRIRPEIMTGLIPEERSQIEAILRRLDRWNSIVIGPGLGRTERARSTVLSVLNHFAGPVVVDADAIHVLNMKEDLQIFQTRKFPTILTPHLGEFSHFIGADKNAILERPLDYLKEAVDSINCSIVLKGPCSYLGFPSGDFYINYFPNDGMASGGSGDVLAGILGGLLAQNAPDRRQSGMFMDSEKVYQAVCLGVVAHTLAGKYAAEKLGARAMTAGSIVEHLSDAFKDIEERQMGASKEILQ